jgi:RNA binding exosome subunit
MYLGNLLYTLRVYLKDDAAIQTLLDRFGELLSTDQKRRCLEALAQTLEDNSNQEKPANSKLQLDPIPD